MPYLHVQRLPHAKDLPLPTYQTAGAAGMDLYAAIDEAEMRLWQNEVYWVRTGIRVEIPEGFEGQIRPRSSLGRRGIIIPNSPGTIDNDFRGEVMLLVMNLREVCQSIHRGDRIAQLIISPVAQLPIKEVEKVSETVRGEGGFGSTGQ